MMIDSLSSITYLYAIMRRSQMEAMKKYALEMYEKFQNECY